MAAAPPWPPRASEWEEAFLAQVSEYKLPCSPEESAAQLRKLVRSQVLQFMDMKRNPNRFFLAHRLLATRMLGGFGIRFTVQYNLFVGSIVGLGSPEQIASLGEMQERGDLGCFALTETNAGVMSGFIVETTATWEDGHFIIHTPHAGATKNWISQGLVADWVVVIARLVIGVRELGPHPFLLRMRHAGRLTAGISVEDMGSKTVANDLDNARIRFDRCVAPREALLSRFATVCPREGYKLCRPGFEMRIEVIGQRLLTGRLVIAEAAVVAARVLLLKTWRYAELKLCNGLSGQMPLAELPHLRCLFDEASAALDRVEGFCRQVEERLSDCLRADAIPDAALVEAICVAKVRCTEVATNVQRQLEEEVGSYALMQGTGFEHKDMLLCCRFAEGDTRVLKMKIARDRLSQLLRDGLVSELWYGILCGNIARKMESWLALRLARAMRIAKRYGAAAQAWEAHWKTVYSLADAVCARHVEACVRYAGFPERIVPRL